MSKLQVCADWTRPSPSSPRLPVLGSVQSDLTVGTDRTEPYPRPGPSGLVESLSVAQCLLPRTSDRTRPIPEPEMAIVPT